LASTFATAYVQSTTGQFQFFTAPSGTAGNAITFTQAMTLDASGSLGIGITSPSTKLHVEGANGDLFRVAGANENFYVNCGSQGSFIGDAASAGGEAIYFNAVSDYMAFYTASTERARIDSSGSLLVAKTSANTTTPGFEVRKVDATTTI
jgi:hypothetical protein